ncbi:hypothetical protein XENOCAPTIV_019868, partial [Xenoophorus captivus]
VGNNWCITATTWWFIHSAAAQEEVIKHRSESPSSLSSVCVSGCLVCVRRFTMVTERFLQSEFPSYQHLDQDRFITHRSCRVQLTLQGNLTANLRVPLTHSETDPTQSFRVLPAIMD